MKRAHAALLAVAAAALLSGCKKDPDCRSPTILCGDVCVDAGSDPTNCGNCGVVCGSGQTCCGACIDVQSDPRNCGGCRQDCGVGTCTAGSCDPCSAGTHCPADPWPWCRDTTSDEAHCGACGNACTFPGAQCQGSLCGCYAPDPVECTSAVSSVPACTDLHDPDNCGTCGEPCRLPGKTCTTGSCDCGPGGLTDCGPAGCFDLQTDEAHCGGCVASACTTGQLCCGASCKSVATDPANCGSCGNACAADRVCTGGTCACAAPKPLACGTLCCAGAGCCGTGGTACQTAHSNGLGGTFFDCVTAYPTPQSTTRDAALAAASSWQPVGNTFDNVCGVDCLARQTTTACSIWCYRLSLYSGRVATGGSNCAAACNAITIGASSPWGQPP